jgi:hypothetical protein
MRGAGAHTETSTVFQRNFPVVIVARAQESIYFPALLNDCLVCS